MLKFKDLMERINETRSLNLEEVEQTHEEAPKGYGGKAVTGSRADSWKTNRSMDKTSADAKAYAAKYAGMSDDERRAAVRKSKMKEEVEGLDELSTDALRKYRAKAKDDAYDASDVDDDRRLRKRSMGSWDAGKKILKRGDKLRAEEVEQIDELSRKTLSSYTASAARDMAHTARKHSDAQNAAADVNASLKKAKKKNNYDSPAHKQGEKLGHRWMNRAKGIDKATNRLAKEEVEQTDEALKGSQHKIDANKNGKVDGHDFKILRNQKKARYQ